jgi:putative ABC transport system ATP-binding protein
VVLPVVSISELSYGYGNSLPILNGLTLNFDPKEIIIITGPSGSGKTTLLTLMGALRSATVGHMTVMGHDLMTEGRQKKSMFRSSAPLKTAMILRKNIGFIFQNHNLIKALTAQSNVEMALELDHIAQKDRESRSKIMLKRLGLGQHCLSYPAQLSGGQRQRVAIARALVRQPALILADEPTASLDFASATEVMACFKEAASVWGTTTIMVTHDQRLMPLANRVIALEDGLVVKDYRNDGARIQ